MVVVEGRLKLVEGWAGLSMNFSVSLQKRLILNSLSSFPFFFCLGPALVGCQLLVLQLSLLFMVQAEGVRCEGYILDNF